MPNLPNSLVPYVILHKSGQEIGSVLSFEARFQWSRLHSEQMVVMWNQSAQEKRNSQQPAECCWLWRDPCSGFFSAVRKLLKILAPLLYVDPFKVSQVSKSKSVR